MKWLLIPPGHHDVLVAGERILYCRRRHWVAVVPEAAEFAAVGFLFAVLMVGSVSGLGTAMFFGTVVSIIVLRPLLRRERWRTAQLLAVAVIVLMAIAVGMALPLFAAFIVIVMAARTLLRTLRWTFYQRTYLTDRRVMEVDGFLGIRINSMPLARITDVALSRSALGEILGYGTFRVETAGQEQALGRLEYLVDVERFHNLVIASPAWQ